MAENIEVVESMDRCSTADRRKQLIDFGLSPRAADAAMQIDDTMTHIRRKIIKRELFRQAITDLKLEIDVGHLIVITAIHMRLGEIGNPEVTVGMIAEQLSIDPSRASRLVADAVEQGLVRRVASQADARRICLQSTPKGCGYYQAIVEYKALTFADALHSWDENELVSFSEQFVKFGHWVSDNADQRADRTSEYEAIAARLKEF